MIVSNQYAIYMQVLYIPLIPVMIIYIGSEKAFYINLLFVVILMLNSILFTTYRAERGMR